LGNYIFLPELRNLINRKLFGYQLFFVCDACSACWGPVTMAERLNGVHEGVAAGRACWVVAGSLCTAEIQGTFAKEFKKCEACDFYIKVHNEECSSFRSPAELLSKIKE
jgi:hypothetical protein